MKTAPWGWLLFLFVLAQLAARTTSTLAPATAPTQPTPKPTPFPTPPPTPCLSSCPAGYYNKDWLTHLEGGVCKDAADLSCLVCPNGFYKTSGNSWTACSACGNANAFCKSGKRSLRSTALCTYRGAVLNKFIADGTLAQTVAVENQQEEQYDEAAVRDSQDTCGDPSVSSSTIELQIIKPASSVTKIVVTNAGALPVHLHDFALPSWIKLFDNAKGTEVADEAQLNFVVLGKSTLDVYILIKTSDIPSEDLKQASDFKTSGVLVASGSITFMSSQVIATPGIDPTSLSMNLVVEISEPSLSLLPSENTWSMKIGSIDRRALALYNMQVKKINWVAEVVYNSDDSIKWLSVKPASGSLEQGFECTKDGEVISTNGVNKAEIVATVDGTNLAPGSYTATIKIKQSSNEALFSVTSAVKLEVLPGDVAPEETVFAWEVTQTISETIAELSASSTGSSRRLVSVVADAYDEGGSGTGLDDGAPRNEVYLPNTELTILPRDRFGIDTNQFSDEDSGNFNVTWWGQSEEATDSGTIYISRNPIDNTFVGDLDIRQKGTYTVEITMSGSGEHIKGSPLTLEVHSRICLDTANSEPHPKSGYTCVCSAGYGKTADSQVCEPCPSGQHRDESMLTVTPFCRTCDQGMYQDETASANCKYCPLGHQPNVEQTACEACQDSYVVDETSPTRSCVPCGSEFTVVDYKCVCKPEFYWANAAKTRCSACPKGAFCGYGDQTTILPLQGYWRTNWDPMHFEPCPNPESCLGVTEEHEFILRISEAWALFLAGPNNETRYVDGTATSTSSSSSSTSSGRRLVAWRALARSLQAETAGASGDEGEDPYSASAYDEEDESDVFILPPVQEMNGCAEGFTGPLCKECAPGYYPLGTGVGCIECDSLASTVGFFLLSVFAGFAALGYLITRTIRARGAPRRREVMVLKIVLSHLQIIAMTRSFQLEWPPAMNGLFQVFDILSSAGSSALSTHCLVSADMDTNSSASAFPTPTTANSTDLVETEGYGISDWTFLAQSLGYALAPILLGCFYALWWSVIVPMYRDTTSDPLTAREKTIVSIIVLLIVLQPFLTRAGFEFFSCSDEVDGRSFLEAQFTVQCWVGLHRKWIALGSLMLTFYAVGIPFCAGLILYRVVRRSSSPRRASRGPTVGVGSVSSAGEGTESVYSSTSCDTGTKIPKRSLTLQEPSKRRSLGSVGSTESGGTYKTRASMGSVDDNVRDLKFELAATRRLQEAERARDMEDRHLRYQREREEIDALEKWRPVYGFIYSGYRKECFYWEIVIMTRKALFATISVIFRPVGVDIQTYAGLLVLVVSIVLHVHYRPYSAVSKLHFIETLSLSICFLTLMCGLLIFSPNTGTFSKQMSTLLIILSNILFFLFVAYSIRATLKESARRFYETSRSVVVKRSHLQHHMGSSMRSLRLGSEDRKRRPKLRSKRPVSTSSQEAVKHGLVAVSELPLAALEEGSHEDLLSPRTPSTALMRPGLRQEKKSSSELGSSSSVERPIVVATLSTGSIGGTVSAGAVGSRAVDDEGSESGHAHGDEMVEDEDDVFAEYMGDEREQDEEEELEVSPEAEHFVGISYRLQREAERQHRQGNHAAAARTAMLAANTAIEALRQPDATGAGTRSRPTSLASSAAGRPISGRLDPDIFRDMDAQQQQQQPRRGSRPNSLTSATSSLVGSLKRNLPSFYNKHADASDGNDALSTPISVEGNVNNHQTSPELEEDAVSIDTTDEAQLPPRLVVTSADLAKS